ncbi:MAG: electron transfer flavoprotein subunit beta/FixA family protein [Magnetococcales bacterium]|nr:electron transfer flavoprotein subunit beta/FixA family protein [Magnetococcales bacterium]
MPEPLPSSPPPSADGLTALVALRQLPDPAHPARLRLEGGGVETGDGALVLNPFDEIALEQAVQWRESGAVARVIAATVGEASWEGGLRTALALGADQGVRVVVPEGMEPLNIARLLAALARRLGVDLLLGGRQGADLDQRQTLAMTAALLGWGFLPQVAALRLEPGEVHAGCSLERGVEWRAARLPTVISCDLRLVQPRYASLPAILKARRHPLIAFTPFELGVALSQTLETLGFREPVSRPPGIRVNSAAEMVAALRQRGALP